MFVNLILNSKNDKKYVLQQFKLINQNQIRFVQQKNTRKQKIKLKNNFYAPYRPYDNLWCGGTSEELIVSYIHPLYSKAHFTDSKLDNYRWK